MTDVDATADDDGGKAADTTRICAMVVDVHVDGDGDGDDGSFDLRELEPKVGRYDQLNNYKHLSFMYSLE